LKALLATVRARTGKVCPVIHDKALKAQRAAVAALIALLVATSTPVVAEEKSNTEAAVEGCVAGAVVAPLGVIILAVLFAPFTQGNSLHWIPSAPVMGGSAALGCTTGAAGNAVANELDKDDR